MQSDEGGRGGLANKPENQSTNQSANPDPVFRERKENLSEESKATPRLAFPPSPGPPPSNPLPPLPTEPSLLLPEQRQYIVNWLHQTASPEDCEPANSGQGTNKEARKLQDQDSKALGESQGQPEIERRFQSLRIRESQEQQREPTELSFSPPFGQPSRVLSNLASSDALPAAHPTGDERPGDNSSSRESSPRD
ncbi:hypothetical protein VTH82DRAFT_3145 [Thermothelomyces myriococcoides]